MYCGAAEFICVPSTVIHVPVLLDECMSFLAPQEGSSFADLTFGGGGHTRALLSSAKEVDIFAMDCDPDAIERAEKVKKEFGERFRFEDSSFVDLDKFCSENDFDGVLMDLGISSFQLSKPEKGFSFKLDAPIDMRLNPRVGQSAAEFLETASRESLVRAVREYGEERRWNRVVNAIVEARGSGVLSRTTSAAKLVAEAVGGFRKRQRIHPATKTFQGIRIAINGELESLAVALPKAFRSLKVGGTLAVISFHSLEDRMVKRFMRKVAGRPVHRMDDSYVQDRVSFAELIQSKAVFPTKAEVTSNPRSRSARLRVLKKLGQVEL